MNWDRKLEVLITSELLKNVGQPVGSFLFCFCWFLLVRLGILLSGEIEFRLKKKKSQKLLHKKKKNNS